MTGQGFMVLRTEKYENQMWVDQASLEIKLDSRKLRLEFLCSTVE